MKEFDDFFTTNVFPILCFIVVVVVLALLSAGCTPNTSNAAIGTVAPGLVHEVAQ